MVARRTVRAVASLPARGVKVVIASARPPRSVRHVYELLGLDTWQVNYNGAMVWDATGGGEGGGGRAVHHRPLSPEVVRLLIARGRAVSPDVIVQCETLDQWYTDRDDPTYTTETGRLFRPDLVAPLEQFIGRPTTKLMFLGPPTMIDVLTGLFRTEFPQVEVVRADPDLIQITDAGVSKAAGLRHVAEAYGVPMSRVMAIGDALNDVEMLQAAGVAVAVANAHPAVKAVAHWIAPSNNRHGVHVALVRYGLVSPGRPPAAGGDDGSVVVR